MINSTEIISCLCTILATLLALFAFIQKSTEKYNKMKLFIFVVIITFIASVKPIITLVNTFYVGLLSIFCACCAIYLIARITHYIKNRNEYDKYTNTVFWYIVLPAIFLIVSIFSIKYFNDFFTKNISGSHITKVEFFNNIKSINYLNGFYQYVFVNIKATSLYILMFFQCILLFVYCNSVMNFISYSSKKITRHLTDKEQLTTIFFSVSFSICNPIFYPVILRLFAWLF